MIAIRSPTRAPRRAPSPASRHVPRLIGHAALGSLAILGVVHLAQRFSRAPVPILILRAPARRLVDDVAGVRSTPRRDANADDSYYAWKACLAEHAGEVSQPCDE